MEAHELFTFAADLSRKQASMVTNGKSDAAAAIKELARRGTVTLEGCIYSIKHDGNGRWSAAIDRGHSHGWHGGTRHQCMEWLAKAICPDMLPLCKQCNEARAVEEWQICFGCDDRNAELRNDYERDMRDEDGDRDDDD